jgi:hypothetical protein
MTLLCHRVPARRLRRCLPSNNRHRGWQPIPAGATPKRKGKRMEPAVAPAVLPSNHCQCLGGLCYHSLLARGQWMAHEALRGAASGGSWYACWCMSRSTPYDSITCCRNSSSGTQCSRLLLLLLLTPHSTAAHAAGDAVSPTWWPSAGGAWQQQWQRLPVMQHPQVVAVVRPRS